MAKQIIIRRTFPDKKGGTYEVDYEAPEGMSADDAMKLSDAAVDKLEEYTGDPAKLSPSCGITVITPTPPTNPPVTPPANPPSWDPAFVLSDMEAGAPYYRALTDALILNKPTGVSVARFVKTAGSLPFLTVIENKMPTDIAGTPPASAIAGTVVLTAYLTDGSSIPKEFSIGVKPKSDLYGVAQTGNNNIIVRVGPDSSADTSIKLVSAPNGYGATGTYLMNRGNGDKLDSLGGRIAYFTYVYQSPPQGRYVFQVTRSGASVYAAIDYDPGAAAQDVVLQFTGTAPTTSPVTPSAPTPVYDYEFYEFVEANRIESLAVTTTALDYSQNQTGNQVDCFVLAKVSGNPTIWTGVFVNGSLSSGTGTGYSDLSQGAPSGKTFPASWSGYQRLSGINTLANSNNVRIEIRTNDANGTLLLNYSFDAGLPMLPLKTVYTAPVGQGTGAYAKINQSQAGVDGWAANTKRYYNFSGGLSNESARNQFAGLSLSAQLSATTTTEPAVPNGKQRVMRVATAVVTTYPSFTRGVIVGNSITTHSASTALNWTKNNGMAASSPAQDYAHIVEAALKQVNPNFTLAPMGQGSGLELSYNSSDADAVKNTLNNLNYDLAQRDGAGKQYDLILFYVGENTPNEGFNEAKFRSMVDQTIAAINKAPTYTLVLRNSFWAGNEAVSAVMRAIATEKGAKFLDLTPIRENQAYQAWYIQKDAQGNTVVDQNGNPVYVYPNLGVRRHPGNEGHVYLGNGTLDLLKTTTTVVTPPATTNPPTTAPGVPANGDYVAVADQGWDKTKVREKYIENDQIKVGFLYAGAVISYAALKRDGRNLVNSCQVYYDDEPTDFRYGKVVDDLGRQIMSFSDYCTPGPNPGFDFKNGKSSRTGYTGRPGSNGQGQHIFNTGANPVQGGSLWPALTISEVLASAIYTHPTRGIEFYSKSRAAVWGVKGEPGWIVGEQWVSLKGQTICIYARHNVEERDPSRIAEQRIFQALEQENPCMWIIAPLTQHLINLPGEPRKNIWPGLGFNVNFSPTYHTADCRIGAYEGQGGTGITYYSPMNSGVKAGQNAAGTGQAAGDWTSDPCSYLNGAIRANYDNPGIYDDYCYITLGTESEANNAIAGLPGIDQSFSFDFSKENMRWWNVDSRLIREAGNNWTWYLDAKTDNGVTSFQCKFQSPFRAWQASNLQRITFEAEVFGASQFDLIWTKPGPDNGPEYAKRFNVTGDGQRRTYTVETSDANWNGIISSVGLKAVTGSTNNGAKAIFRTIYKS